MSTGLHLLAGYELSFEFLAVYLGAATNFLQYPLQYQRLKPILLLPSIFTILLYRAR
jgi:hypothetical protein